MLNDDNYISDLSRWTKKKGLHVKGKHQVDFCLAKADIQTALGVGYPMKLIWKNMVDCGRISSSYEMFVANIRKHNLKNAKLES